MKLLAKLGKVMLDLKKTLHPKARTNLNFDYAFILQCIKHGCNRSSMISEKLHRDSLYISRALSDMVEDKILVKVRNKYKITPKGEEVLKLFTDKSYGFSEEFNNIESF